MRILRGLAFSVGKEKKKLFTLNFNNTQRCLHHFPELALNARKKKKPSLHPEGH